MKNNKVLVSVIMPAYNASLYLRDAIDSILNQSYHNFELIIINDGSTDNTEAIILSYSDFRIRYVKNEENLKLIKTLNKGIDLALGKYIARMDADDISLSFRLEKEIQYLENNPSVDVVSCFPNNIDSKGKFLCHSSYFSCTENLSCRFVSLFEPPILHPGVMFRANILQAYKYSDQSEFYHIEAFELWNRMLFSGIKVHMIPEYLFNYRDNATSICHTFADVQWERQLALSKSSIKRVLNIDVKQEVLLVILQKSERKDIVLIRKAFELLDEISTNYCNMQEELTRLEKKEIEQWCKQRKLAILLSLLFIGKGVFKIRICGLLLCNIYLLMCRNNLNYLRNRIIRLINER